MRKAPPKGCQTLGIFKTLSWVRGIPGTVRLTIKVRLFRATGQHWPLEGRWGNKLSEQGEQVRMRSTNFQKHTFSLGELTTNGRLWVSQKCELRVKLKTRKVGIFTKCRRRPLNSYFVLWLGRTVGCQCALQVNPFKYIFTDIWTHNRYKSTQFLCLSTIFAFFPGIPLRGQTVLFFISHQLERWRGVIMRTIHLENGGKSLNNWLVADFTKSRRGPLKS